MTETSFLDSLWCKKKYYKLQGQFWDFLCCFLSIPSNFYLVCTFYKTVLRSCRKMQNMKEPLSNLTADRSGLENGIKPRKRSQKLESEVSKVNPRFLKNSWRSKNGPKIAKLFLCFLTTWWKFRFPVHFWTFRIFFLNRKYPLLKKTYFWYKIRRLQNIKKK